MAVSKRLRYEILTRDNNTCRYCGGTVPDVVLTIDHVVPQALGGPDTPDNLVAACTDCNAGKTSTTPGAALVADVADDAVRWAHAQHVAARQMLDAMAAEHAVYEEFDALWNSWHTTAASGAEEPIERPADWRNSIDAMLAAGLPVPILLDSATKALSAQHVKSANTFRYMCGIAWNRVSDLRIATSAQLGNGAGAVAPTPGDQFAAGRHSLATEIYGMFGADAEQFRNVAAENIGLNAPDAELTEGAVLYGLSELRTMNSLYKQGMDNLVTQLDFTLRSRARTAATEELLAETGLPESQLEPYRIAALTARHAAQIQAQTYLDAMSEPEREGWLAVLRTDAPAASEESTVFWAAYVARLNEDENIWSIPGMCIVKGDLGVLCPNRATAKVGVTGCEECPNPAACEGHLWFCQEHAEMLGNGSDTTWLIDSNSPSDDLGEGP